MNAFEQLIGKTIIKILRQYSTSDLIDQHPIALFLQTEATSGIQVSNIYLNSSVCIGNMEVEDVRYNFEIEHIDEPPIDSELGMLTGKTITNVKVGEFLHPKLIGDGFIVSNEEFAGIVIEAEQHIITVFGSDNGLEIHFNTENSFPNEKNWVLK